MCSTIAVQTLVTTVLVVRTVSIMERPLIQQSPSYSKYPDIRLNKWCTNIAQIKPRNSLQFAVFISADKVQRFSMSTLFYRFTVSLPTNVVWFVLCVPSCHVCLIHLCCLLPPCFFPKTCVGSLSCRHARTILPELFIFDTVYRCTFYLYSFFYSTVFISFHSVSAWWDLKKIPYSLASNFFRLQMFVCKFRMQRSSYRIKNSWKQFGIPAFYSLWQYVHSIMYWITLQKISVVTMI